MSDLLRFLEIVCDGQWNNIPMLCEQNQVDLVKLCQFVKKLADEDGVFPPFTMEDFKDKRKQSLT